MDFKEKSSIKRNLNRKFLRQFSVFKRRFFKARKSRISAKKNSLLNSTKKRNNLKMFKIRSIVLVIYKAFRTHKERLLIQWRQIRRNFLAFKNKAKL